MLTVDINHARAQVYQLLSSLFAREIDRQRQTQLSSNAALLFWQQLASDPVFSSHVTTISSTINGLTDDSALLELAADYCGLFLVGGKHSASPYASLYLDNATNEPLLFGAQHQQMSAFLHQSQLQVQSHFPEPADHLAVMLAYMAHLCEHSSPDVQLSFLETCLESWLPAFCQQVTLCDRDGFYRAVALLSLEWIKQEKLALQAV